EWVFDSGQNKIMAKFPEYINPNQTETTIPVAEGLVVFQGGKNHPVKNIHFEGITFCHSAWNIPLAGYCGIQACHFDPRPQSGGWSVVPAAITANWAENCSFVNCIVKNTGGSGIWLGTGCKNNTVSNSVFTGISGNGIMIGEGRDREIDGEKWYKTAPEQVALGNSILNCEVKDCGTQFYGAVGIWCGLTAETTIKGNEICDLPYTGISVGWMWSPEPTPCRANSIDGNHIHHIMNILSDGGGIYMLGLQPGSKIINNHIHDVKINAGRAESNGMFLDEGTTDVVVANNLIYNIAKSPLRFHRATANLVKNNYLFCQNENPPIRYNSTSEELIQKVDNMVISDTITNYLSELNNAISIWKNSEKK
ncbi:MAG: right-handed parallel beta-helix repeat-containing protein, partial [Prolixibacteraceae bacterium]|nr:right-handed parallel beta-helix repeat-containing protein [Prolixibacteraceae bacterium]